MKYLISVKLKDEREVQIYEFENEKSLIMFAKTIFKSMGILKINSNKNYYIKPRYSKFDIILSTENKSPVQLKNIIIKNNKR